MVLLIILIIYMYGLQFAGKGNSYYHSIFSEMERRARENLEKKGVGEGVMGVRLETKGELDEIVPIKN